MLFPQFSTLFLTVIVLWSTKLESYRYYPLSLIFVCLLKCKLFFHFFRRPKLNEIQGLNECRTNNLSTKKEKLEKVLRDLQDDLKKTEEECAKQIQKFDEDIRLHLTKIKNLLKIKIRSLDEIITQRHQQIDQLLSNSTLEELN